MDDMFEVPTYDYAASRSHCGGNMKRIRHGLRANDSCPQVGLLKSVRLFSNFRDLGSPFHLLEKIRHFPRRRQQFITNNRRNYQFQSSTLDALKKPTTRD